MKKALKSLTLSAPAIATSLLISVAYATVNSDTQIGHFATESLSGWEEKSLKGNTHYELVTDNEVQVLKAHTQSAASILYRESSVDLQETPILNWAWKVDQTFDNINEQTRSGDDFPARLYVVVKTGLMPWNTLAINYVWASNTPEGQSWSNPFTDKAKMIVVQSGETQVGEWVLESRNVKQDFKDLFNIDIDGLDGFAVMVDGDNSNQEATAWFGKITFNPS